MQTRIYSANVTSVGFAVSAAGRIAIASLLGRIFPMRRGRKNGPMLARGAQLQAIGDGGDGATGQIQLWRGHWGIPNEVGEVVDAELQYLGLVDFTLSTSVGLGTGKRLVLASERYADTYTWTVGTAATAPKGIGDIIATATDAPDVQAFSPASNIPGLLLFPDVGDCDFLYPDVKVTGGSWGTGGANVIMSHLD